VQEVHAVGVVVAGGELLVEAALLVLPAGVEEQIHGLSRHLVVASSLRFLLPRPA